MDLNNVTLTGNIGVIETKVYGDRKLHSFKLGVNSYSTKAQQETTQWFPVEFWTASDSKIDLRVGCGIALTGRLKADVYQPKGAPQPIKEIVVAANSLKVTHWPIPVIEDADTADAQEVTTEF